MKTQQNQAKTVILIGLHDIKEKRNETVLS